MSWKRTRAKKALIELYPFITSEEIIFNYKEVEDKIYVRYTFQQFILEKKDISLYLNPIITDGKIEEVSTELSLYLDDILKKQK